MLIQEKAALCSFTEPENSPKVIAIWGLYSPLEERRPWESIQASLNLWVKIGTWMTSFIRSQLEKGPLGPKGGKDWGAHGEKASGQRKRQKEMYHFTIFTVRFTRNIDLFLHCFLHWPPEWRFISRKLHESSVFMRRADTQQRDLKWRTWRWRLDGLSKWKALHQRRGIPAFSSSFFCYSLERVALFFSQSALSPPDLGTDKGGERTGEESRESGGREADRKPCFYSSWCSFRRKI